MLGFFLNSIVTNIGLPGGTRTGSTDPVLIFHHTPDASERVDIPGGQCAKAELVLNKQGGLQALAGISNFGQITSSMEENKDDEESKRAKLAYDVFLDRLMNYVGAYVVKAQGLSSGLDGIVFSGGIGEKSTRLREDIGNMFSWMGCKVDKAANEAVGKEKRTVTPITEDDSRLKLFVCLTVRSLMTRYIIRQLKLTCRMKKRNVRRWQSKCMKAGT